MIKKLLIFIYDLLPGPPQRFINRSRLWWRLLKGVKGVSPFDSIKLWIAALVDPWRMMRFWKPPRNPYGIFAGCVRSGGLTLMVRARSDDVYFAFANREPNVNRVIHTVLKPGDFFVDGGCNIGIYTLQAAQLVGPTGTIFGIDLNPENIEIVKENARRNGINNIKLHCGALYHTGGKELTVSYHPGQFGMASIYPPDNRPKSFNAKSITLDEICEKHSRIKLIKLDIERAEYHALLGAETTLSCTENVVFECHPDSHLGKIKDLLREHGFFVAHLSSNDYLATKSSSFEARTDG